MASVYDKFDWPFQIRVRSQETGTYDANSIMSLPSVAMTIVKGHLSTYTRSDAESNWRRTPGGILEEGTVRFFSETLVPKGWIAEFDQTAVVGERVVQYRVLDVVRTQVLMQKRTGRPMRYEHRLQEIPAEGPVLA